MLKKIVSAALAAILVVGLAGCAGKSGAKVPVVSVATLNGKGDPGLVDRYAGVIVSENIIKIEKDANRTIGKVFVKAGDEVTSGDVLFSYDAELQRLELDKQKIELERMVSENSDIKSQIADLEKKMSSASKDQQLQYTVEINSLKAQYKEGEYNIKIKRRDIAEAESNIANTDVTAPVSGRVTAVNESGTDNNGSPLPYITIQQSGAYRVKGTVNELNRPKIYEGAAVTIQSRTDPDQVWSGTVSKIDTENPVQNGGSQWGGLISDTMDGGSQTASSSYPFYVDLADSAGLLLGQHVYIMPSMGASIMGEGIWLPSFYVCFETESKGKDDSGTDEVNDTRAYVWAADKHGKLEQRTVYLGDQDPATGSYEIVSGLSMEDYIASPDTNCVVGARVDYENPKDAMTDHSGDNGGTIDDGGAIDNGGVIDNGGMADNGSVIDNGGAVDNGAADDGGVVVYGGEPSGTVAEDEPMVSGEAQDDTQGGLQ